jgi:hypothetical protein
LMVSAAVSLLGLAAAIAMPNMMLRGREDRFGRWTESPAIASKLRAAFRRWRHDSHHIFKGCNTPQPPENARLSSGRHACPRPCR